VAAVEGAFNIQTNQTMRVDAPLSPQFINIKDSKSPTSKNPQSQARPKRAGKIALF